jgi:hypothetical protein
LRDGTGRQLINFYFVGGEANYRIADLGGSRETGLPFTAGGLDVAVTLLSQNEYSLRVVPLGNESATVKLTGTLQDTQDATGVQQIQVYTRNAGTGARYDMFFNDVRILKRDILSTVDEWRLF